jgi:hypothetical protein
MNINSWYTINLIGGRHSSSGGGNSGHVLSVGSIHARVFGSNRVRNAVLLPDAPCTFPVPLCLGKVALALVFKRLRLAASGLVTLDGRCSWCGAHSAEWSGSSRA